MMDNVTSKSIDRDITIFSSYCTWYPLHSPNQSNSYHCGLFILSISLVPKIPRLPFPICPQSQMLYARFTCNVRSESLSNKPNKLFLSSQLWVFFADECVLTKDGTKHIMIILTYSLIFWSKVWNLKNIISTQHSFIV